MNVTSKRAATLVSALALTLLTGTASATNGYFTHGVGTESKGMAGTGVGSDGVSGPIMGASNPALAVFSNDSWEVGLSVFSPRRSYSASSSLAQGQGGAFTVGQGNFDSSSEWFPIPYIAKNFRLGNELVINTSFYGRGGMNTDWDDSDMSATSLACDPTGQQVVTGPGPFCAGGAGVDLSQAFLSVNLAGKAGDGFSWGIGPVFAFQMFEADGVGSFTPFTKTFAESILSGGGPVPADNLTNNGRDTSTGFGFAGGIWWAMGEYVSAGLSYHSKLSMSEFDDYSDLFAEAGGFDIPASTMFGISFKGANNVRVNLDVEHTEFGDVASVGNPMANIAACPTAGLGGTDVESCLGGKNGAGFGWDDMTTFKLGVEWTHNDSRTWRFGYSYGEQPIDGADVLFNILAPGVVEQHFTVGMSQRRPGGGAWNFSLMYAPSKAVKGVNMFDPTQEIEIKMNQFEFEVSYLW
ncbi:MAG: outer membrane protein transport protein [Woeseiaceae bacterium]|nr:outer membrane protein transport protein [Woeseiaceae bacterium]